jgi:integral membrane sensor domain MASE1
MMNDSDQHNTATSLSRRRSRIVLGIFLIVAIALSIAAALVIQRGLGDHELQQELRELREQQR